MVEGIITLANLVTSVISLVTALIAYKLAKQTKGGINPLPPSGAGLYLYYTSTINVMQAITVISFVISAVALVISLVALHHVIKKRK